MTQEQLFASFVLDEKQGMEIALKAEHVSEATPIIGVIQKLPGSIDFIEGVMHLRDDVIPVINLKKRLGLPDSGYADSAKIAVVSLFSQRFGLLFDDIREVFSADSSLISPISKMLQTEDHIISALIKLDTGRRVVELLDINSLFKNGKHDIEDNILQTQDQGQAATRQVSYSRYVVFTCGGQEYGVPVEFSREITFCSEINDMFKNAEVDGALELRGKTIPVLNAGMLLPGNNEAAGMDKEDMRVLVLASEECSFGMVVEGVKEIVTIPDDEILAFPKGGDENVRGMYPRPDNTNIILLNMYNLVCSRLEAIKSMARLGNGKDTEDKADNLVRKNSHHLITENCYLVFSIGKNFAIELKDVQEIIENSGIMGIPGATGYAAGVINLRGQVVPVVNLRSFYNYNSSADRGSNKLIICHGHGQTIAIEVDQIVTIYKQEQYHATPSLNAQLNAKKDTLDRLIEYLDPEGLKEHVLVVNTHNIIRKHLQLQDIATPEKKFMDKSTDSEDKKTQNSEG